MALRTKQMKKQPQTERATRKSKVGMMGGLLLETRGLLKPRARTAFLLAMIWCCALIGFARTSVYGVAIGLLFLAGFMELAFNSMAQALVQINAPGEIRGRVIGVFSMSASGLRTFQRSFRGTGRREHRHSPFFGVERRDVVGLVWRAVRGALPAGFLIDAGRCRAHGLRFHAPRARAGASRARGGRSAGGRGGGAERTRDRRGLEPADCARMIRLRTRKSSRCAPRREALQNYRLEKATLYVTLEPCAMCIGAHPACAHRARGVRRLGSQGRRLRQRARSCRAAAA